MKVKTQFLLMVLLISGTVLAESTFDREITLNVVSRIQGKSSGRYLFNTLSVETKDGNVILTGKVRDAYLAKQAEEAALKVSGVRSVENKIQILSVSAGDDRLRNLIYRRLQSDDRLFAYFVPAQPSIRIIVDRARVTLLGYVNTEVDRAKAGILARQVTGSLGVENRLQIDE